MNMKAFALTLLLVSIFYLATSVADDDDDDVSSILSYFEFEGMLMHRGDGGCSGSFYTYDAFISAARAFPSFGNTGDLDIRRRELAAFFAQTSQETAIWKKASPLLLPQDSRFTWGYCFVEEIDPYSSYCTISTEYPCAAGKSYHGRGPIQLKWNYNYGLAGRSLDLDLLNDPDMVKENATLSFMTAIWFWMTAQAPKPSSHDVITGQWVPSAADEALGRFPGFGAVTNVINGGLECGHGLDHRVYSRIGFYNRYCDLLQTDPGEYLDCYSQAPFEWGKAVLDPKFANNKPRNYV